MSFHDDLQDGENAEKSFINYLKSQGKHAWGNTTTTLAEKRLYDICDSDSITYEVKYDRKWESTGNVYFEPESLERSTAQNLVYILKNDPNFYIIDRLTLLCYMDLEPFKEIRGGDYKQRGILVPIDKFKQFFEN